MSSWSLHRLRLKLKGASEGYCWRTWWSLRRTVVYKLGLLVLPAAGPIGRCIGMRDGTVRGEQTRTLSHPPSATSTFVRALHRLRLCARRSLHLWARRKHYVRARFSPVVEREKEKLSFPQNFLPIPDRDCLRHW